MSWASSFKPWACWAEPFKPKPGLEVDRTWHHINYKYSSPSQIITWRRICTPTKVYQTYYKASIRSWSQFVIYAAVARYQYWEHNSPEQRLKEWMTIKRMSDSIWMTHCTTVFYIMALNMDDQIFSLHKVSCHNACHWEALSDAKTVDEPTSCSRGYQKTSASPCHTLESWKLPEGYAGHSIYSCCSITSQKEGIVSGQVVLEVRVVHLPGDNHFSHWTYIIQHV